MQPGRSSSAWHADLRNDGRRVSKDRRIMGVRLMAEHKWRLVLGVGEDAPNKSKDEIYWCERCGCVRHDYSHNGGQKSPNYPVFYIPGSGPQPNSQECKGEAAEKLGDRADLI